MKTKADMFKELENKYAEYLGHNCLVPIKSRTKTELTRSLWKMDRAIKWKKLATYINAVIVTTYGEAYWMIKPEGKFKKLLDQCGYAYNKASYFWYTHDAREK